MDKAPDILVNDPKRGVYEELLQVQVGQLRRTPLAVILVAAVITGICARYVGWVLPFAWFCVVAAATGARVFVFPRLARARHVDIDRRLRVVTLMYVITGTSLGFSLVFFPTLPGYERAIQSMLLVAVCCGAVSTNVGYRPVVLAYVVPILLPLAALWLVVAGDGGHGWLELATAGLVLFLVMILINIARDAFKLFRESYEIRFQHAETNAKLLAALERAEAANNAKTRFLASASHDLRQPIHTLTIYSAALAMRPLDERTKAIINSMSDALQALSSELNSLLDISKLDAGLVSVNRKALTLKPFLQRVCDLFEKPAAEKSVRLTLMCPDDVFVFTDKAHFERVVRNLVENAVKYTDYGSVNIVVSCEGGMIKLRVSDTGAGIPESEHEKIFEEFYQLDNPERDRSRGLGLGLAIVRRLSALLNIDLHVDSKPGFGSNFVLMIPASTEAEPANNATPEPPSELKGLRVLIVDDEGTVRAAMRELLEGLGCHVSEADSTQGATQRANENAPDIVLADFRLRGTDNGIATISAVREKCPQTAALLVNGDTAPERLKEADAAGVALLHKPVDVATLTRAIAKSVGRVC